MASQTHEHGRFRPRQRTRRPGGQRRHYATTLAARHGLALRDRGEAGTREVPAPRGPRSEASRWQTPPACTAILQPETGSRYRTGKRRGPARVLPPWGPGPKPAGGRRHPHVRLDCSPTRARATGPGKGGDPRGSCPRGPRSEKPAGGRRHPHVRPQHISASGQASFGTTPPPCSPKRARATDRGEAGIAEAPAPRGGGQEGCKAPPQQPTPLVGVGRCASGRHGPTARMSEGQQGPPPQQPGPSGSWVAEPAEVPPARQGRSQLVSVSGFPSSRASHRHRPTARMARGRSGENGTKAASRPRAMGMSEAGTGPGVACSCLHMYEHS